MGGLGLNASQGSDFDAKLTFRALEQAAEALQRSWEETGDRRALYALEGVLQDKSRVRRHIMDNGGF
jgi:hypothetical protein